MLKILHGAAALVLAVLLELLAGDLALVLPLSGCVLYRITAGTNYCVVFISGCAAGLLIDLLYWRTFPVTALVFGLGLTAARWLCRRIAFENRFAAALTGGFLVGLFIIVPMTVANTLRSGFRTITARAVAGAPELIKECRNLLGQGGSLCVFRTESQAADEWPSLTSDKRIKAERTPEFPLPHEAGTRLFLRIRKS